MKRLVATTLLSIILIIPAQAATAAPGLAQQMKINKAAVKIADKKCSKWKSNLSKSKRDCRFKILTKNGYIPLYDFDLGGPDVNTFEYKRFNPYASPAGDVYATMH